MNATGGDAAPFRCVMHECGMQPLQFNWFRVAMRLYNSLTQSNSKRSTYHQWCVLPTVACSSYNKLLFLQGVFFLQEGPWSLIRLTPFPNTRFSTCLVMSSVVQLVSDFVFTPYVFIISPSVTCVILMVSKISSMFFSTASIPTFLFLPQEKCISVSPNRSSEASTF